MKLRSLIRCMVLCVPTMLLPLAAGAQDADPFDVSIPVSTHIPKREMGVDAYLKQYPEYDGRGTIIAIFDNGVDPGATGLLTTSDGQRKVVDVIDGSGCGDVDIATTATLENSTLKGRTGRTLTMPEDLANPTGVFHVGAKSGRDLFDGGVMGRINALRRQRWEEDYNSVITERRRQQLQDEASGKRPKEDTPEGDLTRQQRDQRAREKHIENLEKNYLRDNPAGIFDCVVWHDGEHWRVLIDTDEDGDLADETALRPFGIAGEFGRFSDRVSSTFAVQVYADDKILSIVTPNGSHGTHVAGIASANFPDDPARNGIAPGARILSVRIGDSRIGGGSTLNGEMRGMVAAAKYGVDVMNASWGGGSARQNGERLGSQVYRDLVLDYNVTVFSSAGNSGPSLSSVGSPGGDTDVVIGVGAYVSAEMGTYLHAVRPGSPDVAYTWSSRGPTKTGYMGVDITAPGGAISPTSVNSVNRTMLMNGTSMSSPAAAGVGALLISAAKQEGLKHSPARIRHALMNTAQFVPTVEVFAQGAGLIQAGPALAHLKKFNDVEALDYFYFSSTTDNVLEPGQGIYVRHRMQRRPTEVPFDVSPVFPRTMSNEAKQRFNVDMVLKPTVPWIETTPYLSVGTSSRNFRPVFTPPVVDPRSVTLPSFGEIHGFIASAPEAGPVVRVPFTVAHPIELTAESRCLDRFDISTKAGEIIRRFYMVPSGATHARVQIRLNPDGEGSRVLYLVGQTLSSTDERRSQATFRLNEGEMREELMRVDADRAMELCIAQMWSSLGDSKAEVTVQFEGITSSADRIAIGPNAKYTELNLFSPFTDNDVTVTAAINEARHVLLPKTARMMPLDERDIVPPVREDDKPIRRQGLRLTYEWSVEEETNIRLALPAGFGLMSDHIGGGITYVIHDQGGLLWNGSLWSGGGGRFGGGITVPKGKITIHREFRARDESLLETLKDLPVILVQNIRNGPSLRVYANETAAINRSGGDSVSLKKGRDYTLIIEDTAISSLTKHAPATTQFEGAVTVARGKDTYLSIPIQYTLGKEPDKPRSARTNDKKDERTALEKLEEEIYEKRVATLKELHRKVDADSVDAFDELYASVIEEKDDDARLPFLRGVALAVRARMLNEWTVSPPRGGGAGPAGRGGRRGTAPPEEEEKKDDGNKPDDAEEDKDEEKSKDEDNGDDEKKDDEEGDEPKKKRPDVRLKAEDVRDEVMELLARAEELSGADEVAKFFGAKPIADADDKDAKADISEEEKKLTERRDRLRDIALMRSDIALKAGDVKEARVQLLEALRWEGSSSAPGTAWKRQERGQLTAEEHYGLALELVEKDLEKDPWNSKLRRERISLYRKLGWTEWADRQQAQDSVRRALGRAQF